MRVLVGTLVMWLGWLACAGAVLWWLGWVVVTYGLLVGLVVAFVVGPVPAIPLWAGFVEGNWWLCLGYLAMPLAMVGAIIGGDDI